MDFLLRRISGIREFLNKEMGVIDVYSLPIWFQDLMVSGKKLFIKVEVRQRIS